MRGFQTLSLLIVLGIFAALIPPPVEAQTYIYAYGNNPWTAPLPVGLGYIDAANGNLHITIPLVSLPERGNIPFTASLEYDSHIWQQTIVNGSLSWQPTNDPNSWGGWRLTTSADTGSNYNYWIIRGECIIINVHHPYTTYENFSWTTPDGHVIPFKGISTTLTNNDGCGPNEPNASGVASDNSGYHIHITNYTAATIYAPDGTQVYPNVEDTNGNYYSSDSNGNVVDPLGRTPIQISTNSQGNQITYAVLNSQGHTSNYIVTTESIPVNTAFGQSGVTEYTGSITVISSITLPDGTAYEFTYDQFAPGARYGVLEAISVPAGGELTFGYDNFKDAYGNHSYWAASYGTAEGSWNLVPSVTSSCTGSCSQNCPTCTQQVTVTGPNGEQTVYAFTLNTGAWNTSEKTYDTTANGGGLIQTVATTYNFSNLPYVVPETVARTLPTATSSVYSTEAYSFDSSNFGNITQFTKTGYNASSGGRTTTYQYLSNANNNMVNKKQVIEICGGTQACSINGYAFWEQITYDGTTTSQVTGVIGHDDADFGTSYTARGNPTLIQLKNNLTGNWINTKTLTYDMTGQVTAATDANSNTTKYQYADNYFNDTQNGPIATTPAGKTNAFVTAVTLPQPFNWTLSYGYYLGTGQVATETDQNGFTTTRDYVDSFDRPTLSMTPIGTSGTSFWRETVYGSTGRNADSYVGITAGTPTTSCGTSPYSACRHDQAELDQYGRPYTTTLMTDPDGASAVTVSYDSEGRKAKQTSPERTSQSGTDGYDSYSYDGLGRVTQVTHSDGTSAFTYYGAAVTKGGGIKSQLCSTKTYGWGYPVLLVDEAGKKRQEWFDAFGDVIESDEQDNTGALSINSCYTYDALGNLNRVYRGSQTRVYNHDSLSRFDNSSTPEGGFDDLSYNFLTSSGSPCSGDPTLICQRSDSRGIVTTYTYDQLNRLTGTTYSDGTPAVTYSYDGLTNEKGFRTGMNSASANTTWTYDNLGWVISEQQTIAGVTKTTSYTYNNDGTLASITYPTSTAMTYSVGGAERAISATDTTHNVKYVGAASYMPPGELAAMIYGQATGFNGIQNSANYNSRLGITSTSATGTGPVQSLQFNYAMAGGNNGTITSITNNANSQLTEIFTYDPLNRILSASTTATSGAGCWGEYFGPPGTPPPGPPADSYGNLTQITPNSGTQCTEGSLSVSASSSTNQITGYGYDAAGNMTSEGGSIGNTYQYDAESRLTSALGITTGGVAYCYLYDGNGLRVEKFHISSGNCASPVGATIDLLYWRATSGQTITETDGSGNVKYEYAFFAGQRVARRDGTGNVDYFYTDQLGSITAMSDGSGNSCYQATFTPYGEEHATQLTCSTQYKFTGYERDAETGLDYAFGRYYDLRLGRFLTPDPVPGAAGSSQSFNRYAYVLNNPENLVDPFGMQCVQLDNGTMGDDGADPPCQAAGLNPDGSEQPYTVTVYEDGTDLSDFGINNPGIGIWGRADHFIAWLNGVAHRARRRLQTPQSTKVCTNVSQSPPGASATANLSLVTQITKGMWPATKLAFFDYVFQTGGAFDYKSNYSGSGWGPGNGQQFVDYGNWNFGYTCGANYGSYFCQSAAGMNHMYRAAKQGMNPFGDGIPFLKPPFGDQKGDNQQIQNGANAQASGCVQ